MSARSSRSRRSHAHGGGHEDGERWLLTYADMITLLLALFMVLFSISSVNISKYRTVQKALKAAFSGAILPGGHSLENNGAAEKPAQAPQPTANVSVIPFGMESKATTQTVNEAVAQAERRAQVNPTNLKALETLPGSSKASAAAEQAGFKQLQREVQAYAAAHGLSRYVRTTIDRRGLVISLLTDRLLFASGEATLSAASRPLLEAIAELLNIDRAQPISVEGNTDDVPIHTALFPSNWELSTARASTIVQFLSAHGVAPERLSATGFADQRPVASNATEAGRAANRRVDIVLERLFPEPVEGEH
jgi:chemotaxis protein MotB